MTEKKPKFKTMPFTDETVKQMALEAPYNIVRYQDAARLTAIYPAEASVTYPLLGLIGEVGEFANKYKKVIRDGREFDRDDAVGELGDILWYLSNLCYDMDISFAELTHANIVKLFDRKDRGVLGGSGDNR